MTWADVDSKISVKYFEWTHTKYVIMTQPLLQKLNQVFKERYGLTKRKNKPISNHNSRDKQNIKCYYL